MEGIQVIASFVSIIVLGVIFAEFVVKNESARVPLIIFTFIVALGIAGLELRRMIVNRKLIAALPKKLEEEEMKKQLGKFVAELFEEDIPFDDEKTNNHD